jgi:hypothetical protein
MRRPSVSTKVVSLSRIRSDLNSIQRLLHATGVRDDEAMAVGGAKKKSATNRKTGVRRR